MDTATPALLHPRDRNRRRASRVLAVIAAALVPMAVATVWMKTQLLDTDRYVATVAPLVSDPAVQAALTQRISDALIERADLQERAAANLPSRATPLAASIASAGADLIRRATDAFVTSDAFAAAWEDANRVAHRALVTLLTGREGVLEISDGAVTIDLTEVTNMAAQRVADRVGLDVSDLIADRQGPTFVLVQSDQLADAQDAVGRLERISWVLLTAALAALVLTVVVAEDRRRGMRRGALALAGGALFTLVALALARQVYLNRLPDVVTNPDAAAAVFDTLTRLVRRALRAAVVLGALLVLAAWLVGPTAAAARTRGWWRDVASTVARRGDPGALGRFTRDHQPALRAAVLGIAAAVLVVWSQPTALVVVLVAVITVVVLAVVDLLARAARAGDAQPQPG